MTMSIFKKGSKAFSIFGFVCPKCHSGKLFLTPPFSFQKPFVMHETCSNCGQNFLPEPGFYYGAMFVGYIFTAWLAIGLVMLFHWIIGWSIEVSFALLILIYAFSFIYFFRLARSIWMNIVFKYDPHLDQSSSNR
jgi:uncharacterized protein (DUF983 family)